MTRYIEKLNPLIKKYFNILSEDFPDFLNEYIETPRMQIQKRISCSCGMYYSKMYDVKFWYSSLDHSIAVALIIWNFTHDKKETLAGLFHDISTPAFKHCIDFMNNDHEKQESTEELTKNMIINSNEIMNLLKKDNISIEEVYDYQIYPIADNKAPMLSADRLEYTLSNGLGHVKPIWNLDDIKEIYSNIDIVNNEEGNNEMCFNDLAVAEKFTEGMSELSIIYMDDKRRFGMQFLADIMKKMFDIGIISIKDLYELSEEEIINKIKKCDKYNISNCFNIWQNGMDIKTSNKEIQDKYNVFIKSKKRIINPLVKTSNGIDRIKNISVKANKCIENCLNYTFDRYLYMDFDFDKKSKVQKKCMKK